MQDHEINISWCLITNSNGIWDHNSESVSVNNYKTISVYNNLFKQGTMTKERKKNKWDNSTQSDKSMKKCKSEWRCEKKFTIKEKWYLTLS